MVMGLNEVKLKNNFTGKLFGYSIIKKVQSVQLEKIRSPDAKFIIIYIL